MPSYSSSIGAIGIARIKSTIGIDSIIKSALQTFSLEVLAFQNFLKGAICSSIAGFSSFCVHAGGTPTSLYLLPLRLKKEIYVGTRIIFFSCVNLIKLPLYVYLSMMNFDTLYQSVTLFPLALIGIFIGYKLLKIIEENLFYNIIYALILVSSAKLIIDFI